MTAPRGGYASHSGLFTTAFPAIITWVDLNTLRCTHVAWYGVVLFRVAVSKHSIDPWLDNPYKNWCTMHHGSEVEI